MGSELTQRPHEKLCQKIYSSSVGTVVNLANEPAIAFTRIQEHIQKTSPHLVEEKNRSSLYAEKLRGINYDLEGCLEALAALPKAEENLASLMEKLNSITRLQQDVLTKQRNRAH
uniref:BLOC-1-related complex subunit 7 n=1 Tax=Mesocestoides corti TaxID=53468 RepID=A0A5K3FWK8_MESCO